MRSAAHVFAVSAMTMLVVYGCSRRRPSVIPPPPTSVPASQAATTQPTRAPALPPVEPGTWRVCAPGPADVDWLVIRERADGERPGCASAKLIHPRRLDISTANVSVLVLETTAIPGRGPGRLILQIDKQGIEITGAHGATVELRRLDAGVWQVVR